MNIPPLTGRAATARSTSNAVLTTPRVLDPDSKTIAAALLLLLAVIVSVGVWVPRGPKLVIVALAMAAFAIVVGFGIVHRWFGILINEQNVMSLSRFQVVVWTIAILSSYLCYSLTRIRYGFANPLNITIDEQLLLAMGISATSFVAAPMVLGTKKRKDPDPLAVEKTAAKTGESPATVDLNRDGTIYANSTADDARFTDVFQGDEVGNTTHVDVAKLQLFFFTVLGVLAYLAAVYAQLQAFTPDADTLAKLPELPKGLTIALGVSHAGYLTSKGIDHTPSSTA